MSKITEIKTHPVSIALKQTLWTAHEELKDSSVILVASVRPQIKGARLKLDKLNLAPLTKHGLRRAGRAAS